MKSRNNESKSSKTKTIAEAEMPDNKKLNLREFIQKYENFLIPICLVVGILLIVVIFSVVSIISNNMTLSAEKNRDYYINVSGDEKMITNCNLKESSGYLKCDSVEILGTFSNYDSVELKAEGISINENKFEMSFSYSVPSNLYKTSNFDNVELPDEESITEEVVLFNKVLNENVSSKTLTVTFKFNESDKNLILEAHGKWQEEEARKKAEAEAKKQAEEEARRQAEEEAAKKKADEERRAAEEAATKEAKEKSEFPSEELSTAIDVCTDTFYYMTGISVIPAMKNVQNSFWSGEEYQQMINIIDRDEANVHVACKYDWKNNTAIITSWNYL